MRQFDVAVVGGGPGGYVAAIKAAQSGKNVCLIEQGKLGGVCLNRGCIPTKSILKSIDVLHTVKHCAEYGIEGLHSQQVSIKMGLVQQRKNSIVQKLTGGVGQLLKANKVTVLTGSAAFIDKNTLIVGTEEIGAAHIIIATGSKPFLPPIPQSGSVPLITSDEALEIADVPANVVIVGGGVIGVEFAYIFGSLGSRVTVIELMDRILPMVDEEITTEVAKLLKNVGVNIVTGAKVASFDGTSVAYELEGASHIVQGDIILMATGRVPNTEGLNLECLNLKMNGRAIATDAAMKTSIPGIYAIGDVNGQSMLAHTASMEGIVAVENILGKSSTIDYSKIPWCIYLQPEIAAVGLTEKQAREQYEEVKVGRFPLSANGKALVEGETKGIVKVIIEPKYNEILGVHIYGIHATDMIAEVVLAMTLEATAEEIAVTVHPHPTVSEVIPEAFHAALHKAIHAI